jgi:hypothetical protein
LEQHGFQQISHLALNQEFVAVSRATNVGHLPPNGSLSTRLWVEN